MTRGVTARGPLALAIVALIGLSCVAGQPQTGAAAAPAPAPSPAAAADGAAAGGTAAAPPTLPSQLPVGSIPNWPKEGPIKICTSEYTPNK